MWIKNKQKRDEKLNVAPGKSITYDDISGNCDNSQENHEKESGRTSNNNDKRQPLRRIEIEEEVGECSMQKCDEVNDCSSSDESAEKRQMGEKMIPIRKEQVN